MQSTVQTLCDLTIAYRLDVLPKFTIGRIDKIVLSIPCNVIPAPFIEAFPGIFLMRDECAQRSPGTGNP